MKFLNDDKSQKATLSLSRWWKRSKLSREMNALGDRMLADIGICREEIDTVVEKSYPRVGVLAVVSGWLNKLAEIRRNHAAAWELSGMDDRELADIGLYRADISSIAKGHYPERHAHASPLTGYGVGVGITAQPVNDDHQRAA